ncbi:AraC family transcriptional regulator [Rubrivirga sp.]|uniref:AraC family transcriptional regulator n=1 Tax=Rubrivirga sp. TaxID=1885344 RepID=UPI003B516916
MPATDPPAAPLRHDDPRARADRAELAERIAAAVPDDGRAEPVPGLHLIRSGTPRVPFYAVLRPCFCVIAQGAKSLLLGGESYRYDPFRYLLVSADLPVSGRIVEASPREPYLGLRLDLDPALVSQVLVEAGGAPSTGASERRALDVSPLDADLLDATLRLVRAAESPREAAVIAPLVTREIVYRLLVGDQGDRLRHVAVLGGQAHRMAEAVRRLHRQFDQAVRMEELAADLGMSASTFYQRFKAVTGMTPLQFQKEVRLQRARRLLLDGDLDAATAGYRVGYNDPSHFSRDYKRQFGAPPARDVERLREAAGAPALG